MTEKSPHEEVDAENLIGKVIEQSLVGLMLVTVFALAILVFRFFQYGMSTILFVQLVLCTLLFGVMHFRRIFPEIALLVVTVSLLMAITALALYRFGLVSPALVMITVLPIIVGAVRGMKQALVIATLMVVLIIGAGTLYTLGIIQPSTKLQDYMKSPINWAMYAVAYATMVFWGAVMAAKLTEYWRQSLRNLKNAENEALREREVVAALQRQQSIVQLSGGVAHDFNNVLGAITINLELARDTVQNLEADQEDRDTLIETLKDALDATERGTGLTRSLVAFAKVAVLEPKKLDINSVVKRSISWMARTIRADIEIETVLADDLRPIFVDEASLSSALLNLIINARDAIPGDGYIQIKTRNLEVFASNQDAHLNDLTPGHYVELTVKDSGTGIAASEQQRIFEPFFSTKGPSAGSGLGLAMVQGFMKQSGGAVYLRSELGSGATFQLLFSVYDEPFEDTSSDIPARESAGSSGARIMIVEDEAAILKSMKRMLIASGYEIRTAINGDQALNSLHHDPAIDLVLSDVVMPGNLQGTDLAKKIQDIMPNIPVILMSGHVFTHEHDLNLPVVSQLLNKPIRKVDLIKAIETGLKRPQLEAHPQPTEV